MILRLENQIYQEQMRYDWNPKILVDGLLKPMNILNQLTDEKENYIVLIPARKNSKRLKTKIRSFFLISH